MAYVILYCVAKLFIFALSGFFCHTCQLLILLLLLLCSKVLVNTYVPDLRETSVVQPTKHGYIKLIFKFKYKEITRIVMIYCNLHCICSVACSKTQVLTGLGRRPL